MPNVNVFNPQSLFALLAGVCLLLIGIVLPPFIWIEEELFYARLPQQQSENTTTRVIAMQIDESEADEFYTFLDSLEKDTLSALGICAPELLTPDFDQHLSLWQEKTRGQLLFASILEWEKNTQKLRQPRLSEPQAIRAERVGYIEPVSVHSMVYPVYKPLFYHSNVAPPQTLYQASFSEKMLNSLNRPLSTSAQYYLPAPDGFSPPMSLRQLKRLPPDKLKGSVLLVGSGESSESGQWISALQTETHTLKALLRKEAYRRSELANFILCLLLILATIVTFNLTIALGLWVACGSVSTLLLSYFTLNIVAFRVGYIWLDLALPIGCALAALGSLLYYFQLTEGRTRQQLLSTYRRHLPDKVVKELMESPADELGQNERRIVTVMFTDIEGFSRMGEELPPDQIINILNEYLSAMTEIIFANNGSLDKYMGDGIMAVYGNIGANDPAGCAYYAVKTALEMQKKMTELQKKWMKEGIRPIQIRIGINTGDALVGNVGHPKRKELTVIGDTVNTSARIERLNKQYNTRILISHGTYLYVKNKLDLEALGEEQLQGKQSSVKVYHVKGWLKEPVS
jgi:class 3 adenylate cyclase